MSLITSSIFVSDGNIDIKKYAFDYLNATPLRTAINLGMAVGISVLSAVAARLSKSTGDNPGPMGLLTQWAFVDLADQAVYGTLRYTGYDLGRIGPVKVENLTHLLAPRYIITKVAEKYFHTFSTRSLIAINVAVFAASYFLVQYCKPPVVPVSTASNDSAKAAEEEFNKRLAEGVTKCQEIIKSLPQEGDKKKIEEQKRQAIIECVTALRAELELDTVDFEKLNAYLLYLSNEFGLTKKDADSGLKVDRDLRDAIGDIFTLVSWPKLTSYAQSLIFDFLHFVDRPKADQATPKQLSPEEVKVKAFTSQIPALVQFFGEKLSYKSWIIGNIAMVAFAMFRGVKFCVPKAVESA